MVISPYLPETITALIYNMKVSPMRRCMRQTVGHSQEVASSGMICLQHPDLVGEETDGQVAEGTNHQTRECVLEMVLVGTG